MGIRLCHRQCDLTGISGVIVDSFGWPWIFYLPLPFGIAMLVASFFLVPRTPKKERNLNVMGYGSLIIGITALQLMLARGERLDWFDSTEIIIECAVAVLGLYWFVANTITSREPFFDRSLFLNRNYNLGNTFVFFVGAVMFLPLLLIPLELQQIGGYPAIDTGYLLMSRGAGSVMGLLILARFRDRVDPRPILFIGLLCAGLASWNMSDLDGGDPCLGCHLDQLVAWHRHRRGVGTAQYADPFEVERQAPGPGVCVLLPCLRCRQRHRHRGSDRVARTSFTDQSLGVDREHHPIH